MRATYRPARSPRRRPGIDGSVGPVAAYSSIESPWGPVYLAATDRGLAAVRLGGSPESFCEELAARFGGPVVPEQPGLPPAWGEVLARAARQLSQFLSGTREAFDLPIDLRGVGDWDRSVLEAAKSVSYGRVTSYGRLARIVGAPQAARAVGGAMGRNPVWIVIPCHRVISGDGGLGGYGGGARMLRIKRALLAREGVSLPARQLLV